MATVNPFDILGDDENDDPTVLAAAVQKKAAATSMEKKPAAPGASKKSSASGASQQTVASLPTKPLPPAEAVREARNSSAPARGGFGRGTGGGYGRGRGMRGDYSQNRDFGSGSANGFVAEFGGSNAAGGAAEDIGGGVAGVEDRSQQKERGPRPPYRGGARRGGFREGGGGGGYVGVGSETGADDERPRPARRMYDRHSGTGRGSEVKREGAGRGNWGTIDDDILPSAEIEGGEKAAEKPAEHNDSSAAEEGKNSKDGATIDVEEKEPEEKEMTLEEYEKIREEKRKALPAMKTEERKVNVDKDLQSMVVLSSKKANDDVYLKLGSDKPVLKKKDSSERDDPTKKTISINLFKTRDGERSYGSGGSGRGRGRGERGGFRGGYSGGGSRIPAAAPSIEDQSQFPTLGGK